MISFRQHVVTIVAVFLALGLGLLAGSAFVQPRLVDQLRSDVHEQLTTIHDLQGQVSDLRNRAAAEAVFNDAALPHLTTGQLLGEQVVLIAQEDVEDSVVSHARQALNESGATVVALAARNTLAPQDPGSQQALATTLGIGGDPPEDLTAEAATQLAERLASGDRREAPGQPDLLHELLSAGYLAPLGPGISDATLQTIGGPGQIVVVLSGGFSDAPVMPPDTFAVPLVDQLSTLGMPVAAGESATTTLPFVSDLRAQGVDGVVTVDDLDESRGGAALILGLRSMLDTGDGGAYGVKDGAAPLPPMP